MAAKTLKYERYLEEFPNCPPAGFKEVEREAFRWTHNPLAANDFIPINIISEPPARMLDELDKMCMGYGLSLFDSLENSKLKYKKLHKNLRPHQKEQFKQDKGDCIAYLTLSMNHGIADIPNKNNGHFTLHEYSGTNIESEVLNFFDIFNDDGALSNQ